MYFQESAGVILVLGCFLHVSAAGWISDWSGIQPWLLVFQLFKWEFHPWRYLWNESKVRSIKTSRECVFSSPVFHQWSYWFTEGTSVCRGKLQDRLECHPLQNLCQWSSSGGTGGLPIQKGCNRAIWSLHTCILGQGVYVLNEQLFGWLIVLLPV